MGRPLYQGIQFTATDATFTDTSLADVGDEVGLSGINTQMVFELTNTGQALTDFAVFIQPHEDAGWHEYLSGTDWDTGTEIMKGSSGGLQTLASGATGWAYINISPCYAFKIQASIASSTTAIVINGTVGDF